MKHLAECTSKSLAEMWPTEEKPDHLSNYSWNEVRIQKCAEGCPVLARTLEHARDVARLNGWLTEDGFTWETARG